MVEGIQPVVAAGHAAGWQQKGMAVACSHPARPEKQKEREGLRARWVKYFAIIKSHALNS